ncbi:hypothetical protein V501_01746 [Pseudogymnoascus sp. VKM F-4519 (FW-2642)]|nr:hypothetical protein V501_01746 [Pseudogymnoascus sp. VKM F-4519 (FW-2642)]
MQFNKILALFIVATAATAAPVEDLEARTCSTGDYCCERFIKVTLFSIRGVGQNCVKNPSHLSCTAPRAAPACCPNAAFDSSGLVCFA